jgi:hypothetical protein
MPLGVLEALSGKNSKKLAELLNGSNDKVREAVLSQREVINCLKQDPADFAQAYAGRILKAVPEEGEVEAVPEAGKGEVGPEAGKGEAKKTGEVERGVLVGLEPEALGKVVNDGSNGVLKYLIDRAENRQYNYLLRVSAGLEPEARIELLKREDIRAVLEKNPNAYKLFLVGFKSRDGINYDGFSSEELKTVLNENSKILEFFLKQGNESPRYLHDLLTHLDRETAATMLTNARILDCFRGGFSIQKFQLSRGDPSCLSRTIVHFGKEGETLDNMVTNEVVDILKEDPYGLAKVFVLLSPDKRQEVCNRLTGQELSAMLACIPKDDNKILFETLKHGPNLEKLMAIGTGTGEFEKLASIFLNLGENLEENRKKTDFKEIVDLVYGNNNIVGKHLRTCCGNFKPGKDGTKEDLQKELAKRLREAGFSLG